MIWFQFAELLATFTEAATGIWFIAKILKSDHVKPRQIATVSLLFAILVWYINQYQIFSVFATVIGILGIALAAQILYQGRIKDTLLLAGVYFLLVYIVDFLTVSVFGMIYQNKHFAASITMGYSMERFWFLLSSKSILVLLSFLITDILRRNKKLPERNAWALSILFILLTGRLIHGTFLNAGKDTLLMWVLLLLFSLAVLYASVQYRENTKKELQMQAAAEYNALISETYTHVIQEYQKNQIFYHDQKNQYLIIYDFLMNQEYEKAQEYMRKLDITNAPVLHKWTDIASLDVLLNYKYQEAKSHNISMTVISVPIDLKIPDIDLIALFGNALDNAMEACFQMEREQPWILVSIQKDNQMTFIKISNSCCKTPARKGNSFLSSKKDGNLHGLGQISMQQIVKKYHGTMQADYDENTFSIVFSFFE